MNKYLSNGFEVFIDIEYATFVMRSDVRWRGPGHNAVLHSPDRDYPDYHAYDVTEHGVIKLRISPITWSAVGWPTARL